MQEWYAPEPGVPPLDMALMALAMGLGKPTKGLERAVFQIQMMHQLLDLRLADTTLLFDADLAMTRDLARQYEHKALDSVGVLVNNINPLYRRVVFDGRNRTMADSIAKVIKNNTAFFAIGAGHLTGPDGLIALLRNKGFLVRPVFSDNAVSVTLMGQIFQTMARNMRLELKKKDDDFVAPPPPPSFNPPGVKIKLAPKAKATRKTKKS